jgi:hypothetical protein
MFGWAYLDAAGEEVGRSPDFSDAEEAEDWIASSWRELFESGVESVVLFDLARERRMYRMGLGAD